MGTTVKIHLPASTAAPLRASRPMHEERPAGGGEVVLVVEDEPDVRRMAERILTKGGYSVISTSGGEEALEICRRADQPIDLLLTDVIMPGMLGTELVEQIKRLRPELGVIFMSGYSHEVLAPERPRRARRQPPSSRSRSAPASCCGPSAICFDAEPKGGPDRN